MGRTKQVRMDRDVGIRKWVVSVLLLGRAKVTTLGLTNDGPLEIRKVSTAELP